MAANATRHGFLRAVNKEHRHWEYHPDEAEAARLAGRCKRKSVTV